MGFRSYDPSTARFTATDDVYPNLALGVSMNRYAYGNANPLDYVDLDGHSGLLSGLASLGNAVMTHVVQPVANMIQGTAATVSDAVSSGVAAVGNALQSAGRAVLTEATSVAKKSIDALSRTATNFVQSQDVQNAVSAARSFRTSITSAAASLDMAKVHTTLDLAGFVPVVGDAVDGLNATLYLLQGDTKNALISFAAMVPVIGGAAVAVREAGHGVRLLNRAADLRRDAAVAARTAHSAEQAANAGDDLTRVGRWMGDDELLKMQKTGLVQEGSGGRTFVTNPADPAAFPAGKGVFAEFDVPTKSLFPAGKPEWSVIPGPNVGTTRFGPPPSQMPPATCIVVVCRR